jgi:hypothetical protein
MQATPDTLVMKLIWNEGTMITNLKIYKMKDEGKYLHLWMKYSAVIRILLKKTDIENQKLQLFKHEFENGGHRSLSGYVFSLEIINGRVMNKLTANAVAADLVQVLINNTDIKNWLKEHSVKFSMEKTFELQIEKI